MRRKSWMNRSACELAEAARQIADWLKWDIQSLSDFHAYAQRFGGRPGGNVFEMVLSDALKLRGLTLDQFRAPAGLPACTNPDCPVGCPDSHCLDFSDSDDKGKS
jgi:hypothetical protein